MSKKEFSFTIGADPEFIFTMQGRKVDAKQTMELMLSKRKEFKLSRNSGFDVGTFGNIGWDGASSTAEIRPSPSKDPQEVVNNMAGMFKAMVQYIKICDMSTLSEFSSIGGHVHLEVPQDDKWSNERKATIHKRMASFYLPLLIAENKTNLNIRLKQGYGALKDQRIEQKFTRKDGTPGYTYEFRCPSAEWLTTPKIAKATLAYFGVVYHEILNHPRSFTKFNDIVFKSDKQSDALQALLITEFDILTKSILSKVKRYIKTFELYPEYKDEIEYIFNPKQMIKDKQKANYNIALGWDLIDSTSLPKKKEILASKKKIQGIAKKMDFDILKQVLNIHYNDDTNVALFAEAFKDRVAAFNWKLKNNYFIFGMRKGIPTIVAKNLKNNYLAGEECLKTILDKEYMDRLFQKMNQKFNNNNYQASTTLDFVTGKPKDTRDSMIVIGIPYEMRVEEEIKPFLSFIWSLENPSPEKAEICAKDKPGLFNDCDSPLEEKGEIYKILTKQMDVPNVVVDQNSQSLRNQIRAVNAVILENDPTAIVNDENTERYVQS